jgi:hypothetical protein
MNLRDGEGQEGAEAQIRPFVIDNPDGRVSGDDDIGPVALKVVERSGLNGAVETQAGELSRTVDCDALAFRSSNDRGGVEVVAETAIGRYRQVSVASTVCST